MREDIFRTLEFFEICQNLILRYWVDCKRPGAYVPLTLRSLKLVQCIYCIGLIHVLILISACYESH